jgi:hypothetical protein
MIVGAARPLRRVATSTTTTSRGAARLGSRRGAIFAEARGESAMVG